MSTTSGTQTRTNETTVSGPFELLLKHSELAARLSMSQRGVRELACKRIIPVIRLGRKCARYNLAEVKAAMDLPFVESIVSKNKVTENYGNGNDGTGSRQIKSPSRVNCWGL